MPVKRRRAKERRAEVPAEMLAYLKDEPYARSFLHFLTDAEREACWNEARDSILADWIARAPGTRPRAWWRYDAPRQPTGNFPECYYDGKLPQPRERLGGIGTPNFEVLNIVPCYSCGIPNGWVDRWEVSYYNGRSKNINGEPIGKNYKEGDFEGVAIDPEDPPRYESQASYLDRHGLFLPGEKKRLRKADFQPELILPEIDPDEDELPPEAA